MLSIIGANILHTYYTIFVNNYSLLLLLFILEAKCRWLISISIILLLLINSGLIKNHDCTV